MPSVHAAPCCNLMSSVILFFSRRHYEFQANAAGKLSSTSTSGSRPTRLTLRSPARRSSRLQPGRQSAHVSVLILKQGICTHTHTYIYIYKYNMCVYVYVYACMYVCIITSHTYIQTYTHTHIHRHTYIYAYIHTYIHTPYVHTSVRTHTDTYIHARLASVPVVYIPH